MGDIIKLNNQTTLNFKIKDKWKYFQLKVDNVVVDNDKQHHSQHYVLLTIFLFSECYMLMKC